MSQLVTPPDIVIEHTVYLVVNAQEWDIEMIMRWLKFSEKKYTIHIYHDAMDDLKWLHRAGAESELIFVNRQQTPAMDPLLDHTAKIVWFGKDQPYPSAVESMLKNGRIN
jgi:hypothetical protein